MFEKTIAKKQHMRRLEEAEIAAVAGGPGGRLPDTPSPVGRTHGPPPPVSTTSCSTGTQVATLDFDSDTGTATPGSETFSFADD